MHAWWRTSCVRSIRLLAEPLPGIDLIQLCLSRSDHRGRRMSLPSNGPMRSRESAIGFV